MGLLTPSVCNGSQVVHGSDGEKKLSHLSRLLLVCLRHSLAWEENERLS